MRPPRLLVCSAALVFSLFTTMSFADDGSEDAGSAPTKTTHHAKAKPVAKTTDKKAALPDCPPADQAAGRCINPVGTVVKGPGH